MVEPEPVRRSEDRRDGVGRDPCGKERSCAAERDRHGRLDQRLDRAGDRFERDATTRAVAEARASGELRTRDHGQRRVRKGSRAAHDFRKESVQWRSLVIVTAEGSMPTSLAIARTSSTVSAAFNEAWNSERWLS